MSNRDVISAIQWKVNLSRCPEQAHHMLTKYLVELKELLNNQPSDNLELMKFGEKSFQVIPSLYQELEDLRLKMAEVDAVLESGQQLLAGYYQHMTAPPEEETQAEMEEVENENATTGSEELSDQSRQL